MTPDVGELLTWAGIYDVVDVLFLASGSNVFTVKMIDMIEFQALGAVSGHEADGAAGGFKNVLGVGDGLTQASPVSNKYSHGFGSISNGLGVE